MKQLMLLILSGKDNQTPEIARILWAIGFFVYLGLAIASEIKGQAWQPVEFATGVGIILFGGASGVAVKAKAEPEPGNQNV